MLPVIFGAITFIGEFLAANAVTIAAASIAGTVAASTLRGIIDESNKLLQSDLENKVVYLKQLKDNSSHKNNQFNQELSSLKSTKIEEEKRALKVEIAGIKNCINKIRETLSKQINDSDRQKLESQLTKLDIKRKRYEALL